MEDDSAEKEKAARAQRLLYVLMAVMILAPLVVFLLRLR
jgi:hypothetical protein